MTRECDIERKFVKYCKAKRWECLKLRIDGENGFPDRTIITPNGIYFIELKRPGGKLRARQRVWLDRLQPLGYNADHFDTLESAIERVEQWDSSTTK